MPKSFAPRDASTVKISSRGASRLKAGHVWVYRSDVLSAEGIPPGSLVKVTDERGKFCGSALYSSTSQIAIRAMNEVAARYELDSKISEKLHPAGIVEEVDTHIM